MSFPRFSSLVLAVGGSLWALLLLWYTFGFLHYSAGFMLLWVLIWLPGFVAWYGHIRRAFGHFLLRRGLVTWLASVIGNGWSLFFMWSYFGRRPSGESPITVAVGLAWIILALVVSIVCMIQERTVREPTREVATHIGDKEFKRLLDEHRRDDD